MNLTQVASGNLLVPSRLTDASGNVDKAGKGRTDEMMSRMKYGRGAGPLPVRDTGAQRPSWGTLYSAHLRLVYRSQITALAWTLRSAGRAAGEALSGPALSWGAGGMTTTGEWKFVMKDLAGLSADNPLTTSIAQDAIERTARSSVTIGARVLGGMFAQVLVQAAVDATYTSTASDIYVVLSRGRGP
jgi:hypothetical protein